MSLASLRRLSQEDLLENMNLTPTVSIAKLSQEDISKTINARSSTPIKHRIYETVDDLDQDDWIPELSDDEFANDNIEDNLNISPLRDPFRQNWDSESNCNAFEMSNVTVSSYETVSPRSRSPASNDEIQVDPRSISSDEESLSSREHLNDKSYEIEETEDTDSSSEETDEVKKDEDILSKLLLMEDLQPKKKPLSEYTPKIQKQIQKKTLNLVKKIPERLFPDQQSREKIKRDLSQDLEWSSSTRPPRVVEQVIESYNRIDKSNSRDKYAEKIKQLTVLAEVYQWEDVQKFAELFEPKIDQRKWIEAKKHYLREGHAMADYENKIYRQSNRVPDFMIDEVIEFVTERDIMSPEAFGKREVQDSSGNTITLPVMTTTDHDAAIIDLTKEHMDKQQMYLSKSTIARILKVLPHRSTEALTNVNPFQAKAMKRFKQLKEVVELLDNHGAFATPEIRKALLEVLDDSHYYMKSILKHEVSRTSEVLSHCTLYGLNDGTKTCSEKCDHQHSEVCDVCNNVPMIIKVVDNVLEENQDKISKLQYNTSKFVTWKAWEDISKFHGHILMSQNQNKFWSTQGEKDNNGEVAFAVADFPQQYLPKRKEETQQQYFAKAGNVNILYHTFIISFHLFYY